MSQCRPVISKCDKQFDVLGEFAKIDARHERLARRERNYEIFTDFDRRAADRKISNLETTVGLKPQRYIGKPAFSPLSATNRVCPGCSVYRAEKEFGAFDSCAKCRVNLYG